MNVCDLSNGEIADLGKSLCRELAVSSSYRYTWKETRGLPLYSSHNISDHSESIPAISVSFQEPKRSIRAIQTSDKLVHDVQLTQGVQEIQRFGNQVLKMCLHGRLLEDHHITDEASRVSNV